MTEIAGAGIRKEQDAEHYIGTPTTWEVPRLSPANYLVMAKTGILLLHGLTGMPSEMRPVQRYFESWLSDRGTIAG
ncbi:MAG: hypothetical protein R3C24_19135 [Cyanobacteriota/Melainabacteria group bacterium]